MSVTAGDNNVVPDSSKSYVNTLINSAGQDLYVVFWSNGHFGIATGGSNPDLTLELPSGSTKQVSFSDSWAGTYAAIYADTGATTAGDISNTWVELLTGANGIFDISREVNMQGHAVTVAAASSSCTANLNTCAFACTNPAATSCAFSGSYTLLNCSPGSQPGAEGGTVGGQPSGGCKITKTLTTTFKA